MTPSRRLCFTTLCCPDWSFDRIVAGAVDHGLGGIDWRGIGPVIDTTQTAAFTTDADRSIARLLEVGVAVPCLCSSITLHTPDEAKWSGSLDEFARHLALADRLAGAGLGTRMIRVFPGATPAAMTRDECRVMGHRRARQLAKLAQRHAATPVLETHDDWNTAASANDLLDDLAPEQFAVLWDARHSVRGGESPDDSVALLGPRLAHIHVKDERGNGATRPIPTLIGEGELPWHAIIAAAESAGYAGWWSLENEKRWIPTAPEPEAILPQFVRYFRSI
jgi:sugar phosphate isomerase/epimerase